MKLNRDKLFIINYKRVPYKRYNTSHDFRKNKRAVRCTKRQADSFINHFVYAKFFKLLKGTMQVKLVI